jgi:hypothetical protein
MTIVTSLRIALAGCAVFSFAAIAHAQATPGFQPPLPTDEKQVQVQLRGYDLVAVAAARHYYQSPSVKADLVNMVKGLTPSLVKSVETAKGKALTDAEQAKINAAVEKAAQANIDLLIGLNMIAALETMSREQLLALDQFYTSQMGQSILSKMPTLNQRLPGIFQAFMPNFSDRVEAEVKAAGLGPN